MKKKVSIVIPALNEKEGIGKTIRAISKDKLEEMGYEVQILVVDGGSNDGTAESAREAGAEVIVEPKRGYGRAYKTGFAYAKGDIIVTTDADGTYQVEDIPRLVKILEDEKLDFLTTNRYAFMEKRAMSLIHRIGNAVLNWELRLLFRLPLKDFSSGMWVFREQILNKLRLHSDTWPFSYELKIEACHFRKCYWREVPIRYKARIGKTKQGTWKAGIIDALYAIKKRMSLRRLGKE